MASKTVTRAELYEQVWTTPLLRLASHYGISNVALGKLCRRLKIPLPGRGHWARVAARQRVKRPPLPKVEGRLAAFTITMETDPFRVPPRETPITVPVPESLAGAHRAVRDLAALLRKAKPDEHGRLVVGDGCLIVSTAGHRRALLLLDGLCKGLEGRGHRPAVEGGPKDARLRVEVNGEPVHVCLDEEPNAAPPRDDEPEPRTPPPRRLHLTATGPARLREHWADTKRRPLERALGHAVVGIEHIAVAGAALLAEAEKRQRAEEERQRQQREAQARAVREQKLSEHQSLLAHDLEDMTDRWDRARKVRDFLEDFQAKIPTSARDDEMQEWLDAALRFCDRLDPLTEPQFVPKPVAPPDETIDQWIAELRQHLKHRLASR